MGVKSEKQNRRSIRLKGYDYSQKGAYFVTICTSKRTCLFGDVEDSKMTLNELGRTAAKYWSEIPGRFQNVKLDAFVVMPNHVHSVIIISDVGAIHELPLLQNNRGKRRQMLVPKIVGFYKMNTAKHVNKLRDTPGIQVWQRNYYEHVIRNKDDLNEIREYVSNNPLKWELDKENPNNYKCPIN